MHSNPYVHPSQPFHLPWLSCFFLAALLLLSALLHRQAGQGSIVSLDRPTRMRKAGQVLSRAPAVPDGPQSGSEPATGLDQAADDSAANGLPGASPR